MHRMTQTTLSQVLCYHWTCLTRMFVSLTRPNRIRKFLTLAVFFLGCALVSALLIYSSGVDLISYERNDSDNKRLLDNLHENPEISINEREKASNDKSAPLQQRSQTERQRLRIEHILRTCEKLNASGKLLSANKTMTPSQFSSIYVDDNRRILYCSVPKVACTNWKRIFLILTGKMNTTNTSDLKSDHVHNVLTGKYLRRLGNYTLDEIYHRIDTYYKFVFVREPFERILSAYFNKFTTKYNHMFRRAFGRRIVKLYRNNKTKTSIDDGHDVTFDEFVAYLLDPRTTQQRPFNEHWRQYYELCHPCFIQYDFIGKYETMQEDTDLVLRQLGVRNIVTFPPYQKNVKTSDFLAQKFSNVSAVDIHRLWKLYSIDFDLFDYPYPRFGLNSSAK